MAATSPIETISFALSLKAIGTNDIQNLSELNSHLKNNFGNSEIKISDELTNEFKKIIMGTNNYQEIIRKGAALVESWSFE